MSSERTEISHGNSPAAWTAVAIMLVAIFAGTVAFYLDAVPVVIGCAVLALLGLLVGYIMRKLGYGVGGAKLAAKEH